MIVDLTLQQLCILDSLGFTLVNPVVLVRGNSIEFLSVDAVGNSIVTINKEIVGI